MKNRAKKSLWGMFSIIGFSIFALFTVCLIVPIIWTLFTTLKDVNDFRDNLFGLPSEWHFENYPFVLSRFKAEVEWGETTRYVYFLEMLGNTFLYAGVGSLICIICHYIVAYCCALYDYKFSRLVYMTVVVTMAIPIVGADSSRLQLLLQLDMYDNWPGFFFQRFSFTGIYFLVLYETIRAKPKTILEAAEIDGANRLECMWQIMLPQVINTLGVILLLTFIGQWNEYQFAVMYMPNHPTLAYGLYSFNRVGDNEILRSIPLQLTGCMLLFFPMLILFICMHDKMMGDLSMGGLKE